MAERPQPPSPAIPADLIHAYGRATYRVDAPGGPFELRVGRRSAALAALLVTRGAATAAFVTAYNPSSALASEADNRAAHESLRRRVADAGFDVVAATGLDPDRRWPDEPGLLVLGIPRADAVAIARAFGQNAILHAGPDAVPGLVSAR